MTVLIDAGPRAGDSEGVGVMFEVLGSRKSDGRIASSNSLFRR